MILSEFIRKWQIFTRAGISTCYMVNTKSNIIIFIYLFIYKYFLGVRRLPQKDETDQTTLTPKSPPETTPQRLIYMFGEYKIKYNNIYIFTIYNSIYILS